MNTKPIKIKIKILVSIVVAVLVFLASLIVFTNVNSKRVTQQNRAYLSDSAAQTADSVGTAISNGYANIEILSKMVSESLTGSEFDVADIQSYVRDSVFDFIEFADKDGMDHNITGGVSDARDRQYYLDAKAGNTGMELIYVSRATHETLLMYYSPIYYEGEFVGSLVGVYQASNKITNLLTNEFFGEKAETYLVRDGGRIIASNLEIDPADELTITDVIEGNESFDEAFKECTVKTDTAYFDVTGNRVGGCVTKVEGTDSYLVRVFPAQVAEKNVHSANISAYLLIDVMGLIFILMLFSLISFYKSQRRALKKSNESTEEALTFANYFLDAFVSAYYVSLKDFSCKIYKRTEQLENDYPIVDNYFLSVCEYVRNDVHPDDREELLEALAPETITELLEENPEYEHIFRDMSGGTEKTYRMQVIRGADEEHAAFGFVDITDELKKQQKYLLGAVPLSPEIFEKANIGMWSFELDEGEPPRMYADNTMLRLIGLDHQVSPTETYHAWYDHIDIDAYDMVAETVEKMVSGEHAEVQYPWHHPNGETYIVRCGGIRNYSYTKGVRIEGTHQNVTEVLHFDEEKRRKERDELSLMLINTLTDSYNILYYINAESGEYQLISHDEKFNNEIQSKVTQTGNFFIDSESSLKDTVFEDDRDNLTPILSKENMEAAFGEGSSFIINYRIRTGERNEWYRLKAVKIKDANGKVFYVAGIMNIEGELKMQADLQTALEEAQAANKAKTDFLFNMSHDIRTPMNAIVGFTNMAQKHIDDRERVLDSLDKTRQASELLLSLINSILDMSRIESGKAVVEQDEGDVSMSFESIKSTMSELAESKDIELTFKVGNIKDRYVYYDHNRCIRIFVNIISNAVKYTPNGGKVFAACEQIASENGVGTYRYTFTDNGIGMSEEFQKHVFEEFSREHNSTTSGIQGTGLGMAVCKSFAELMGGTIECRSKQGVGTTFTVTLPFRTREDASVQVPSADAPGTESFSFKGKRALLVEDNVLNTEIATDILEEEGITVESAEDGSVAVAIMKEKGPDYYDFILMDIQMPVMNGYEATRAIRAMYPDSNIKIIAVSANAFAEDKATSLEAGMNDHVAKPIKIDVLFDALRRLMK